MIKDIIFDFDGTIADTFDEIKKIVDEFQKESEKEIDLDGIRDVGVRRLIKEAGIPFWKIPQFTQKVLNRLESDEIELFEGIEDELRVLSEKYRIGLVTSNLEKNVNSFLKRKKLEDVFDYIYSGSSLFGKHKTLKRLCKKYHIMPEEALYVGDEDRDIIAARKAGMGVLAVSWGYNSERRLNEEKPDLLVASPGGLSSAILTWSG